MIKSMTGYGSAKTNFRDAELRCEIKSVNSKFLDVSLKVPKEFQELELRFKSLVAPTIIRGKIYFTIEYTSLKEQNDQAPFNADLLAKHINQLKNFKSKNNLVIDDITLFSKALEFPDIYENAISELSNEELDVLDNLVKTAVESFDSFRCSEGSKLIKELENYVNNISSKLKLIEANKENRLIKIKENLVDKLLQLKEKVQVDDNRLEQEMIFYVERLDITEEIVRLKSHIEYYLETLHLEMTETGKKLSFIAQEMGREINTIGSKSNDAEMQKHVVDMKDELEKIKEQVLNII